MTNELNIQKKNAPYCERAVAFPHTLKRVWISGQLLDGGTRTHKYVWAKNVIVCPSTQFDDDVIRIGIRIRVSLHFCCIHCSRKWDQIDYCCSQCAFAWSIIDSDVCLVRLPRIVLLLLLVSCRRFPMRMREKQNTPSMFSGRICQPNVHKQRTAHKFVMRI